MRINLLPAERSTKPSVVKPSKRKPADSAADKLNITKDGPADIGGAGKKRSSALLYICWGIFLLGSLIFLIGEYFEYDPAIVELTSLREQVAQYCNDLAKERKIQKLEQKITSQQSELAFITHMYRPWLAIINGLASVLPEEVWLTGVEGSNAGNITVECRSLTITAAQDYIRNLQGNTLFIEVQLREMKQVSPGIPDYTFTLEIKTGGAGLNAAEK